MRLCHGLDGLRSLPAGSTISIGNFDGIHRGHQRLFSVARELAADHCCAAVTFEPHPLTVLRPEKAAPRITPPAIKRALLAKVKVDVLVELPPTPEVLDLSAEEFWRILRDEVRPKHLVEGSSFNFGKGRGGNIETLRQWAAASDVALHVIDAVRVPLLNLCVVPVNSSLVRWLLANGRVRDAAICLGQPYLLEGQVVKGHQRGRTIGVPTANLHPAKQIVPADGVYAGRCTLDGKTHAAAISIGTNPTFSDGARSVEAHLLDFSGDLYGRTIGLELVDWVRDQWKYSTIDALKAQIARDLVETRGRLEADPSRAIAAA